jgi:hypothetical protein
MFDKCLNANNENQMLPPHSGGLSEEHADNNMLNEVFYDLKSDNTSSRNDVHLGWESLLADILPKRKHLRELLPETTYNLTFLVSEDLFDGHHITTKIATIPEEYKESLVAKINSILEPEGLFVYKFNHTCQKFSRVVLFFENLINKEKIPAGSYLNTVQIDIRAKDYDQICIQNYEKYYKNTLPLLSLIGDIISRRVNHLDDRIPKKSDLPDDFTEIKRDFTRSVYGDLFNGNHITSQISSIPEEYKETFVAKINYLLEPEGLYVHKFNHTYAQLSGFKLFINNLFRKVKIPVDSYLNKIEIVIRPKDYDQICIKLYEQHLIRQAFHNEMSRAHRQVGL